MTLGQKLLNLRKERDLTLDELSAKCAVGKATLSRLENDITPGTLRTHMKIAEAFGLSLPEIYRDIEAPGNFGAVQESKIENPAAESFAYDSKAHAILLAQQITRKNMLPQLLILQPGGATAQEENPGGSEKFLFCLEGRVQAKVGENTYIIRKGGSLYFRASLPHLLKNPGKSTAKVICVSSPVTL